MNEPKPLDPEVVDSIQKAVAQANARLQGAIPASPQVRRVINPTYKRGARVRIGNDVWEIVNYHPDTDQMTLKRVKV